MLNNREYFRLELELCRQIYRASKYLQKQAENILNTKNLTQEADKKSNLRHMKQSEAQQIHEKVELTSAPDPDPLSWVSVLH